VTPTVGAIVQNRRQKIDRTITQSVLHELQIEALTIIRLVPQVDDNAREKALVRKRSANAANRLDVDSNHLKRLRAGLVRPYLN
jgi:predicted PhzF superfamily epimerase YddE/YHI9